MERRTFETPLGEIWLWGDTAAFEAETPKIVMITGAFAAPTALRVLPSLLPGAAVLLGDVPGNNCPPLSEETPAAYSAAYSSAIGRLGQPVVLSGQSLGGTVALGVRAPNVRHVVALEPFISPEKSAVLWPGFRQTLAQATPRQRAFLWNIFGIDETRSVPRDHFAAVAGLAAPTIVLAGDAVSRVPSLLSEHDLQRLRAHPMVRVRIIAGVGHDLTMGASSVVTEVLKRALAATV
jgi:hypothetical protein